MSQSNVLVFREKEIDPVDAERAILGSILLDNSLLYEAAGDLRPSDFSLEEHCRIFMQMIVMGANGQDIDLINLVEGLRSCGELEVAGGAPCLASLADGMPRVPDVPHAALILRENAVRLAKRISDLAAARARASTETPNSDAPIARGIQ